jgi:hypothetical protein
VKYLIILYNNPTGQEFFRGLSDADKREAVRGHIALAEDIAKAGDLVLSEALADPALGRRVAVRDGRTLVTDGPFAEVKEHLAGFYLVDCESEAKALEYAARVPEAEYGVVEVRPIMDLDAL